MKHPRVYFPLWRAYFALLCTTLVAFNSSSFGAAPADGPNSSGTNLVSVIQLRPAVQADGEGLFLNQLVSGADLPHLRLCGSPLFGKILSMKRSDLAELVLAGGFDLPVTNWSGPEVIRVSRRTRSLDEKETVQLLTAVLQKQYVKELGELELHLSRPWVSAQVPDEPFTLRVLDIPNSGVAPAFIVRFELETAYGEHIGSWQAALQTKVWREIWVAASPIKRGDCVRGADLVRERRDMLQCREALADIGSNDALMEFTAPVPAGGPIYARLLRPRPIVHRGESLIAMVQDGGMVITLKVEALEDGASGQIIRVRNPLSRRDLHGKVVDEQRILVSL